MTDAKSDTGLPPRVQRRFAADITPLRESVPFRYFFAGQAVAVIGAQVTQVAVPLQVYEISHSSLYVGLVGVASLVPLVVLGLYGGAIADAVNRRTMLLLTSTGSGLVSVVLLIQAALGVNQLWLLYTCVVMQSSFFALDYPARRAILPQLMGRDRIAAANTLFTGVFNFGLVLGPLIGGATAGAFGFAAAYAIDVGTFVIALVTVYLGLPSLPAAAGSRRAGLSSVIEGLRFLGGRKNLLMTFVHDINAMVFGMPRALFPVLAVTHFHGGRSTAGLLYSAPAIGALLIAISGGWTSLVRRQGLAVVLAIAVWGTSIALFGFVHAIGLGVLLLAIAGAADAVSAIFRSTILQVAAPVGMQGRLSGVFIVVVAGGPRLGDLESGAVATAFTPTISVVSGGAACLVGLVVLVALVPSFLQYDARHPTP
ncbi:MAG: MFS transporter [Actinomycetes bacterium]